MDWIYLSPHFDDVALSCGGLAWEQAQAGQLVAVWTLCAGRPPEGPLSAFAQSLHARWESGEAAAALRQVEDIASCRQMGAGWRHFEVPDCIYRRGPGGEFLYDSEEALWGGLHPGEAALVEQLASALAAGLPGTAQVVCPLGLGSHADHLLARAAAEQTGRPLWYYADYPYVLQQAGRLEQMRSEGWKAQTLSVSAAGLAAWQAAIAAHASQISTFWPDLAAMQAAIAGYCSQKGGIKLWKRAKKGA